MVSTVLRYLLFLVGLIVIHLEVFESIFRSRLVPSLISCFSLHRAPWSSWLAMSSRLLAFLSCCDKIPSLVDVLSSVWPAKWHTGATLFELSKMREITFDTFVQRTLHLPRILRNPVSGGESPGLSSTASAQTSSSGASRSARKRSSASLPSSQSGKSGKNHQDKRYFLHLLAALAAPEVKGKCRVGVNLTVRLSL